MLIYLEVLTNLKFVQIFKTIQGIKLEVKPQLNLNESFRLDQFLWSFFLIYKSAVENFWTMKKAHTQKNNM